MYNDCRRLLVSSVWPQYRYRGNPLQSISKNNTAAVRYYSFELFSVCFEKDCQTLLEQLFLSSSYGGYSGHFVVQYKCL